MDIGMNEPFNDDWRADAKWSDLFNQLRWPLAQVPLSNDYNTKVSVFDVYGRPLVDCSGFAVLREYPNPLTLKFNVLGSGSLWLNGSSFGSSGTLVINGQSENFSFQIKDVNRLNPCYLSLKAFDGTITPIFKSAMQKFEGPVRVMNALRTNNSPVKSISDFPSTTSCQTDEGKGLPTSFENIVKVANELNRPLFFNIPHLASDSLISYLAQYFFTNLQVPLILEYSNEIWNASRFWQGNQILDLPQCQALPGQGWDKVWQYQALRTSQIASLFKAVYGSSYSSKVKIILCGQLVNPVLTRIGLSFLADNKLAMPDILGFANYVGAAYQPGQFKDLTSLFASLNTEAVNNLALYTLWRKLGDDFSIKDLALYEWGQSLVGVDPLFDQAQDDPRMGDLYRTLIQGSQNLSFGCHYYTFEKYNNPNSYRWGLSQGVSKRSIKRDVVESFAKGIVDSSPAVNPVTPPIVIPPVVIPTPQTLPGSGGNDTIAGGLNDDQVSSLVYNIKDHNLTAVYKSGKVQRIL